MSTTITERERLVDKIYIGLQVFSGIVFVITGLIGYFLYTFIGLALGIIFGFLFGMWMRYSMGSRGKDPFYGYYIRMRERANGSRPGVLEYLLEKARGNEFTRKKCIAITIEFEKFETALKKPGMAANEKAARDIYLELDKKGIVKSYMKEMK